MGSILLQLNIQRFIKMRNLLLNHISCVKYQSLWALESKALLLLTDDLRLTYHCTTNSNFICREGKHIYDSMEVRIWIIILYMHLFIIPCPISVWKWSMSQLFLRWTTSFHPGCALVTLLSRCMPLGVSAAIHLSKTPNLLLRTLKQYNFI